MKRSGFIVLGTVIAALAASSAGAQDVTDAAYLLTLGYAW